MIQMESSERLAVRGAGVLAFCLFFAAAVLVCLFLVPAESVNPMSAVVRDETDLAKIPLIEDSAPQETPPQAAVEVSFTDGSSASALDEAFSADPYTVSVRSQSQKPDAGLELYRSVHSRAAVEWFYTSVTGSRDVACAVLEAADRNDIPLSLAFSLAYTESRYKVNAVNKNRNASIDRGLFQLNNRSFPALVEGDFFDPYVSAKYGMSHLRHCLDTAGNEVSALAMYNAGTNRVRNDATPQVTLNYVSNIISYRQGLDELFDSEVVQFYCGGTGLFLALDAKSAR